MTNKVNWAVSWTFLDHQEYCSPLLERSKQIPTVSNWPIWPLHSLQRNLSRLHVEVIRRIFHPACDGPGGAIIIFITPINCFKNTDVRDGAAHVGTICVKRNLVILMEKTTKVHTQHNQPKLRAFNKEIVQFEGGKKCTYLQPYFTFWILWKIQRPGQAVTWSHLVKETQNRHLLRPRTCDARHTNAPRQRKTLDTSLYLYILHTVDATEICILCHICDSKIKNCQENAARRRFQNENVEGKCKQNSLQELKTPPEDPQPRSCLQWVYCWGSILLHKSFRCTQDLIWLPVVFHCIQRSALPACSQAVSAVPTPLIWAAWINGREVEGYEHPQHHSILPICHEDTG